MSVLTPVCACVWLVAWLVREGVFSALLIGQVPEAWGFCYPSQKPLGSWMRDLVLRCGQMRTWVETELPKVFWLSGFTYPTGFLTALLQTSARRNGVAIDSLSWEFPVLNQPTDSITSHPKEGASPVSCLWLCGPHVIVLMSFGRRCHCSLWSLCVGGGSNCFFW